MTVSLPTLATKKALQIALVGVRPADQVMLKGYMRVLLHLDTALEWVSANHPSIDLYMVNIEFAEADSVKKLLDSQPKSSVLYIQRDETNSGIVGNVLTLPLKKLEQLQTWLNTHLTTLNAPASVATPPEAPAMTIPEPAVQSRMTLDEIIASRAKDATVPQPSIPTPSSTAKPLPTSVSTTTSNISLLGIVRKLQQREDILLSLVQNDTLIAYIHPKRQRIWVLQDISVLSDRLVLQSTSQLTSPQPKLADDIAQDLVQWLWQKSYATPAKLLMPFIKTTIPYQITSWIKPSHVSDNHDILKIQSVLEARAVTLSQLLPLSQTSKEVTVRTTAALAIAGVMQPAVYSQLIDTSPITIPSMATVLENIPVEDTTSPATMPSDLGHDTNPQDSSPVLAGNTEDGMKGFLSKLRRKLGI